LTNIIDGKAISANIKEELKQKIAILKEKGIIPGLAVILVGQNSASEIYVKNKEISAKKCGMESTIIKLESHIQERDLIKIIETLNKDKKDAVLLYLGINAYDYVYNTSGKEVNFGFFDTIGRSFEYSFVIGGTIFRTLGQLLT